MPWVMLLCAGLLQAGDGAHPLTAATTERPTGDFRFGQAAVASFSNPAVTADTAVLFLHGFPAEGYKNEDLARHLAELSGFDTYVIHYEGLGTEVVNEFETSAFIIY